MTALRANPDVKISDADTSFAVIERKRMGVVT
jgi:hypothetical protein